MSDLTPAQEQAVFLRALADHLDAHPGLPHVTVDRSLIPPTWRLRAESDETLKFTALCRSLNVTGLRVFVLDGFAECRAATRIGGIDVTVWSAVHDLQRHLVEDRSVGACISEHDGLRLTVSDLEYFATHGTLPEAGGTDE